MFVCTGLGPLVKVKELRVENRGALFLGCMVEGLITFHLVLTS